VNPLKAITVRYADGRMLDAVLANPIKVIEEHQPFERVSDSHIRATAFFKPISADLENGQSLSLLPDRVEAKRKSLDSPWLVTIEGQGQTWETFYCDLATAKSQPRR
jgi:hypothetical protein